MLILWGMCLALTIMIYASIIMKMRHTISLALSYFLMLTFGVTALYTLLHV
jgi:hypothetical protein